MKRHFTRLGFDLIQATSLPAEVISAAPSLVWSVLLLMPGCTFCTADNYGVLAGIPEGLAAWAFVSHLALFVVGWRRRSYRLRQWATGWGVSQWLAVTAAMVAAQPHNTAWCYLVFASAALLAKVQLGFAHQRAEASLAFALSIRAIRPGGGHGC